MDTEHNTEKEFDDVVDTAESEVEILDENFDYEDEPEIVEESGLNAKLKKLRDELRAEKKQSQEYLTGWQTERASFANYKSEEEKNRVERIQFMKTNLVSDFFPVLDSFDMAFSNREAWEQVEPAWRTGVEYIYTQFMNTLEQYNVTVIDTVNVPFNPLHHDPANMIETDDELKSDFVEKIIQKGYMSGDTVIRPAKVNIYKYVTAE